MKDSNLIYVSKALKTQEWSAIKKEISKEHQNDSDIRILFQYLFKYKGDLDAIKDVDFFIKKYKPTLSHKGCLNLMSKLAQEIEEWIIMKEIVSDENSYQLLKLKAYNNRGLYNKSNKLYAAICKNESTLHEMNEGKLMMQSTYEQYYSFNPVKYEEDHGEHLLRKLLKSRLEVITNETYLLLIELNNWGMIKNIDFTYEKYLLSKIVESLPNSKNREVLLHLLKLSADIDVDAYDWLFQKLKGNNFLTEDLLHDIVVFYLLTYIYRLINDGKKSGGKDLISLYQYAFEVELFERHSAISSVTFNNLIANLSQNMTYEEVDEFIDTYSSKVNSDDIESDKNVFRSINSFYHKRYKQLLDYTRFTQNVSLTSKNRLLLFELIGLLYIEDIDLDKYQLKLNNYRRFLKRNSRNIPRKSYNSIFNLIKLIDLILKSKWGKKVTIDMNDYSPLYYRSWVEQELLKMK